jgi:hypothetical protein
MLDLPGLTRKFARGNTWIGEFPRLEFPLSRGNERTGVAFCPVSVNLRSAEVTMSRASYYRSQAWLLSSLARSTSDLELALLFEAAARLYLKLANVSVMHDGDLPQALHQFNAQQMRKELGRMTRLKH